MLITLIVHVVIIISRIVVIIIIHGSKKITKAKFCREGKKVCSIVFLNNKKLIKLWMIYFDFLNFNVC